MVQWSINQKTRLRELNAPVSVQKKEFNTNLERDSYFKTIVKSIIREKRELLNKGQKGHSQPVICEYEYKIAHELVENGFIRVVTPIIIHKSSIEKMLSYEDSKFVNQIFWLNKSRCLRPMLAPNLYTVLKKVQRSFQKPVRIFEVGPCFRKDTRGKKHLNEFTMINLVELGTEEQEKKEHFDLFTKMVMKAVGIDRYWYCKTTCEVYGDTIDIVSDNVELGSGVIGPHELDARWGITDNWVGIGFGLERLAFMKGNYQNIQQVGRSLHYLDGVCLNM